MKIRRLLRADIMVPALIALIVVLTAGVLADFQKRSVEGRLLHEAQLVGSNFSVRLQSHVDTRLRAGWLLGQRISRAKNVDESTFEAEAALTHQLFEDFQALNWVDANGIIRVVTPRTGNERAIGLDLKTLPFPSQALWQASQTGALSVTPPIELAQGGRGFTAYAPVNWPDQQDGFVNIVFRTEPLLKSALATRSATRWALIVTDAGQTVYRVGEIADGADPAFEQIIDVGDRKWQVVVAPSDQIVALHDSMLGEGIIVVGLVIASILAGMTRLLFRRQASLRYNESLLREITENIEDVVWVGSSDFLDTFYINPAFEKVFGLSLVDLQRDHTEWARKLQPVEAEKIIKTIEHVSMKVRSGDDEGLDRFEYPIYKVTGPDGITRDIYARSVAMRDASGRIDRFVGVATDVSDILHAEARLRESQERLAKAQKMEAIGQLTSGVAHDFNNILAVIQGNIELLERLDLPNEARRNLSAAKIATLKGADLTKSLLSFAKKARLEQVNSDINELIEETVFWSSSVIPDDIEVKMSLDYELWAAEIDPGLTQNAILNIILNAKDAMPDGGKLELETRNVLVEAGKPEFNDFDLKPGPYVCLSVTDTGHGIPQESLSQIFDPFFTTKPVGSGSGLGLSMVQGFMKQSGGGVEVVSSLQTGTTFNLYFMATASKGPPSDKVEAPREIGHRKSARILLVEDDKTVMEVTCKILRGAGYFVTCASSGDEALQIFGRQPHFDLLMTDAILAGEYQGEDIISRLRSKVPDLAVIVMSGDAVQLVDVDENLRDDDIRLLKPVLSYDLLDAVAKVLSPVAVH